MRHFINLVFCLFLMASCKKNEPSTFKDYTYYGNCGAHFMETLTDTAGNISSYQWDSSYVDRILVSYDFSKSTVTFRLSPQYHIAKSFQNDFTFSVNNLQVYTANHDTNTSHTFSIIGDSLNAYMLKREENGNVIRTYSTNFGGKIVQ